MEDLEHALGYVKPTVSEKDVDDIEWFSKNGRAPPDDGEYRPRGRHERVPGYN